MCECVYVLCMRERSHRWCTEPTDEIQWNKARGLGGKSGQLDGESNYGVIMRILPLRWGEWNEFLDMSWAWSRRVRGNSLIKIQGDDHALGPGSWISWITGITVKMKKAIMLGLGLESSMLQMPKYSGSNGESGSSVHTYADMCLWRGTQIL